MKTTLLTSLFILISFCSIAKDTESLNGTSDDIFFGIENKVGVAGGSSVRLIRVDKSGKGIIGFSKELTGTLATCVPTSEDHPHKKYLAFDTNTEAGKAILATALSAQANRMIMTVNGTGTCDIYGTIESIDIAVIKRY